MFVDSSALIAVLAGEADGARVSKALERAGGAKALPLVRLETAMVMSTLLQIEPEEANAAISELFRESRVETVPLTDQIAHAAVRAFAKYGKGRSHPARLNFSDCMIYAAARSADAPLLFIGDDFTHTDLVSVLPDPRPM